MDEDDSRGLLRSFLGILARKNPDPSGKPASLKSRKRDAWLRADAFLQLDSDSLDEIGPDSVEKTLRAFENYVYSDSDGELASGIEAQSHYPKLKAVRKKIESSHHDTYASPDNIVPVSKRGQESDAVIEELSRLDRDAKKRRVLLREETSAGDSLEDPNADSAIVMRSHLISLDTALRKHWICVCQKCSGLSVRLSLPQQNQSHKVDTRFEVFSGGQCLLATTLQETKSIGSMPRTSQPTESDTSDFAFVCQSITESLGQRSCLHLALEDGMFQRLRPQPKALEGDHVSRTVSLSAFFDRQQQLRGGHRVLPLKGKMVLAVTLVNALLPFLETPWLQPSFNHSNIKFFQPHEDGLLPDIAKPFLTMEHFRVMSTDSTQKHMVHPNASVLALGILLLELYYCTPLELMREDSDGPRNINTDFYTSLDLLKNLETDAGVDYYLATKACLQWEYYPPGQAAEFDSASVQRLFYQNVVKRLEGEIFKSWNLRLEDLNALSPRENELCWGSIGRDVILQQTSKVDSSETHEDARAAPYYSICDDATLRYTSLGSDLVVQMPAQPSQVSPVYEDDFADDPRESLTFFDASHQTCSEQENHLSQRWMDNLLSMIHQYVDPFDHIQAGQGTVAPIRIAILDSGFDPRNPLLMTEDQRLDPRIKGVRSFVHQGNSYDVQDMIGHGTHALGLLLKVATCAEIYIAKIADRETMDRNTYNDIAIAINYAVSEWKVDIISMSFGIREYNEPMRDAVRDALRSQVLMFAAASNDGANLGRAFPAKYPCVFCIHSTDGNGNPSNFNPTADDKDVNFSLLGEHVMSHWPEGINGHNQPVNAMSGTSVATPIAAGLAAFVLSFIRQQDQKNTGGSKPLGPWLKDVHSMDTVLKSMVRQTRGAGYDYITPHILFGRKSTRERVYDKIMDMRNHMYDNY